MESAAPFKRSLKGKITDETPEETHEEA